MLAIVSQGAASLVSRDDYTDRTGRLRANTEAVAEEMGDPTTIALQMNTEYASFVNARGFSHFDQVVEEVTESLDEGMREVRRRISGR